MYIIETWSPTAESIFVTMEKSHSDNNHYLKYYMYQIDVEAEEKTQTIAL